MLEPDPPEPPEADEASKGDPSRKAPDHEVDRGLIGIVRLSLLILGLAIVLLAGIAGMWVSIHEDHIDVGHEPPKPAPELP